MILVLAFDVVKKIENCIDKKIEERIKLLEDKDLRK